MIRVGIIGLGYWGPNLVRCFDEIDGCRVTYVCDKDLDRLTAISDRFPGVKPTQEADELLDSGIVDAVVIATPTKTHFHLASAALRRGLDTFVEKPLAGSSEECQELIEIAELNQCQLFVGHIFLHSAPVAKLRELVQNDELGDLYYLSCKRLNLGPIRGDVNSLWDLAPHDISIMLHLLGEQPSSVSCSGLAYFKHEIHDVCNLTLQFPGNKIGIVHVSWLDPHKKREVTVVGDKKMAVYDDLEQEKIKVYDKGVEAPAYNENYGDFQFAFRYGDTYSPRIVESEPLKAECSDFIRCIRESDQPLTDGFNGLQVVQVLEAAQHSLQNDGACVEVEDFAVTV
jgi:predicted dehydrogenase